MFATHMKSNGTDFTLSIPDYRTRKIKRAIWCWCIRRWKHTVFHSLPAHDLFNPWRDSFLYRWPSKEFGTLCLLCSATLRVHDAGIESLMMIVASTVPDFLMVIITGAGIQGVMMLLEAFSRSPDRLPKPLRRYPMHSIALHKHANQGFYKNDFEGLAFPNNLAGGPPTITGEEILKNTLHVEMGYSKVIGLGIMLIRNGGSLSPHVLGNYKTC
jgi:hypothetical protein